MLWMLPLVCKHVTVTCRQISFHIHNNPTVLNFWSNIEFECTCRPKHLTCHIFKPTRRSQSITITALIHKWVPPWELCPIIITAIFMFWFLLFNEPTWLSYYFLYNPYIYVNSVGHKNAIVVDCKTVNCKTSHLYGDFVTPSVRDGIFFLFLPSYWTLILSVDFNFPA